MRQATCHQIALIRAAPVACSVGLERPAAPSRKLAAFLKEHFALGNDDVVLSSVTSRHSAAGCTSVQDTVLYRKPDGLKAGQVWAHVAVRGTALTLVQQLRLLEHDRSEGTAVWIIEDAYEFVETRTILDAVIWLRVGDDMIRTLMPRDLH